MNSIQFVCTALAGVNKVGNLKQTDQGYFRVVLGALNMFNSAGEFYDYEPARSLFEGSSQLMRRCSRGALRGEYGHPKPLPGQSSNEFAHRVMSIYEDKVSHHIMNLTLDFENVKDPKGKPVIAIIGDVMPAGPMGAALERSLKNPNENVCFSIRAFTDDHRLGGIVHRHLKTVVTWDYVNEPGLSVAEKWQSPALESQFDHRFTRGDLEQATSTQVAGMAQESVILSTGELFNTMGWDRPKAADAKRAGFLSW